VIVERREARPHKLTAVLHVVNGACSAAVLESRERDWPCSSRWHGNQGAI
jgi:hypothetical protein